MYNFFKAHAIQAGKTATFIGMYTAYSFAMFQEKERQDTVLKAKNPGCKITWDYSYMTAFSGLYPYRIEEPGSQNRASNKPQC